MLSKKMAFSLMSLITLLAFAFAFVADDAFAAEKPFEIKIAGRATATYATLTSAVTVNLVIESAQPIPVLALTGNADTSNVKATAIDRNGFLVTPAPTIRATDVVAYPMRTAKTRQLMIVITQVSDRDDDDPKGAIAKVVIEIPAIMTTDPTVLGKVGDDTLLNMSKLVQHTITLSMAAPVATAGLLPRVVSVQRLRPGSQTVVSAFQEERIVAAPFNVRIVLTAPPARH